MTQLFERKVRSAGGWHMGFCRKCLCHRPIFTSEYATKQQDQSSIINGRIIAGVCDCCGTIIAIAIKSDWPTIRQEQYFQVYQ